MKKGEEETNRGKNISKPWGEGQSTGKESTNKESIFHIIEQEGLRLD